jgi:hypothetical protein
MDDLDNIVKQWLAGNITAAEALAAIEREGLFAEAFMIALTHSKPAHPARFKTTQ